METKKAASHQMGAISLVFLTCTTRVLGDPLLWGSSLSSLRLVVRKGTLTIVNFLKQIEPLAEAVLWLPDPVISALI